MCVCLDIEFKEGDKEHVVEVEVLFDGVREMREAFTLHLKPDENMVAETQVRSELTQKPQTHMQKSTNWISAESHEKHFLLRFVWFLIWPWFFKVSPTEIRDSLLGCLGSDTSSTLL